MDITRMESLATQLTDLGVPTLAAEKIAAEIDFLFKNNSSETVWQQITKNIADAHYPFAVHQLLYKTIYPNWNNIPAAAWFPDEDIINRSNIKKLMRENNLLDYVDLHQWSTTRAIDFWQKMITILQIQFDKPYTKLADFTDNTSTEWLVDAKLNIARSCFQQNENTIAIISQNEQGERINTTVGELNKITNRIANALSQHFTPGENIAIIMPMTRDAVAIYLGIIKIGCVVISIPESFSTDEIATRLRIANAKAVFCQDEILREGKSLPLYKKIIPATTIPTIVLAMGKTLSVSLREQDIDWKSFLHNEEEYAPVSCSPDAHITILFSSGTTGEPKAIPWTHTTPIKCGSDAHLHHNLQPGDIFCWPTSLGWMMGPWLIFACLLNHATIALYDDTPCGEQFGKFIQDTGVTHLGVVPTIVKNWRHSGCMEKMDWRNIKLFTSTGERSNIDDMLYLMALVNYRPIIEYCGGTEIAGAYITGTVVQPVAPAAFTTPALGLDFVIIDEHGKLTDNGEVALIPPSIGLSTRLLNKNHYQVYYAGMPILPGIKQLRRHGDQVQRYNNGFYRLLGRIDDTMNLSGIKVSAAEIELAINTIPVIDETAAIAIDPPTGGPSQLIIYAVLNTKEYNDLSQLKLDMQNNIKNHLNPLFKIHDVVIIDTLPRTASNKIMRRVLRDQYQIYH